MSAGRIDTTFENNGSVIYDNPQTNIIQSMCIQSDNKIVIAGSYNSNIYIKRLNPNGDIDTTFGISGEIITSYVLNPVSNGTNDIIIIQSTGKIILLYENNNIINLIRYNSNGSIDTTFGPNGIINTNLSYTNLYTTIIKNKNNDSFSLVFNNNSSFSW